MNSLLIFHTIWSLGFLTGNGLLFNALRKNRNSNNVNNYPALLLIWAAVAFPTLLIYPVVYTNLCRFKGLDLRLSVLVGAVALFQVMTFLFLILRDRNSKLKFGTKLNSFLKWLEIVSLVVYSILAVILVFSVFNIWLIRRKISNLAALELK